MAEVKINLPAGSYIIHIINNGLADIGRLTANLGLSGRALVISDTNVVPLYGEKVLAALGDAGITARLAVVPAGEETKSLTVAGELYTTAIEAGLDRRSPIIALGGGVVGDLAGFVAATYQRGVPFIQVPTTLLAQVDSSVGGKVAVNHPLGKNLIGAFYQPLLVVADPGVLNTLPDRELISGLAEVVKHGVIADPVLFDFLNREHDAIMAKEPEALTEIVRRSCQIKSRVVEQDEKESGLRMILNFGHTIGHAVEAVTGYGRYTHGEGVAIGMHGAALISHYQGLCTAADVEAVRDCAARFGMPLTAPGCDPEELLDFLARDKKNIGGNLSWVLLQGIGRVDIKRDVPETVIRRVLAEIT